MKISTVIGLALALASSAACRQDTPAAGSATDDPPASRHSDTRAVPAEVSATASASAKPPPKPPVYLPAVAESGPVQVVDLHVDTPWKVHFKDRPLALPRGHATMKDLEKGHYIGIVYPIYIPDYINDWKPTIADADAIFGTIDRLIATHEQLVDAAAGPVADGKIAAFVSIEGAGAFAADINAIDRFIARGVRLVGPVHAHDNLLATSATGKKYAYGLSDLGKAFCRRVYAKGALIDVSHMSDKAFADLVPIAAEARAPIIATHSNSRKLRGHKRNLTDEQLAAIATSGGVAGVNLYRSFVAKGTPKIRHVVAQTMHMIDVMGIDHVAIGSDFDGGTPVLKSAGSMPKLVQALRDKGLSDEELRKLFAGNALRILPWQASAD